MAADQADGEVLIDVASRYQRCAHSPLSLAVCSTAPLKGSHALRAVVLCPKRNRQPALPAGNLASELRLPGVLGKSGCTAANPVACALDNRLCRRATWRQNFACPVCSEKSGCTQSASVAGALSSRPCRRATWRQNFACPVCSGNPAVQQSTRLQALLTTGSAGGGCAFEGNVI